MSRQREVNGSINLELVNQHLQGWEVFFSPTRSLSDGSRNPAFSIYNFLGKDQIFLDLESTSNHNITPNTEAVFYICILPELAAYFKYLDKPSTTLLQNQYFEIFEHLVDKIQNDEITINPEIFNKFIGSVIQGMLAYAVEPSDRQHLKNIINKTNVINNTLIENAITTGSYDQIRQILDVVPDLTISRTAIITAIAYPSYKIGTETHAEAVEIITLLCNFLDKTFPYEAVIHTCESIIDDEYFAGHSVLERAKLVKSILEEPLLQSATPELREPTEVEIETTTSTIINIKQMLARTAQEIAPVTSYSSNQLDR